jgi:hypothetical protein
LIIVSILFFGNNADCRVRIADNGFLGCRRTSHLLSLVLCLETQALHTPPPITKLECRRPPPLTALKFPLESEDP